MKLFLLLLTMICLSIVTIAQHSELLESTDSTGKWTLDTTVQNTRLDRAHLYEKMKRWSLSTDLNANDDYIGYNDGSLDSIKTFAFIVMDNIDGMKNQFVDYKVAIIVNDGFVRFLGTQFLYHGSDAISGEEQDVQLKNLAELIGDSRANAITADFDRKLGIVVASFVKAAQ